jgi:pyridoxal phosphate enzyme (YggS family)
VLESRGLDRAVAAVRERIAQACTRSGRSPQEVRLIAVTKAVPPEVVRLAAAAGVTEFGENYVQELEAKRGVAPGARWHFLGRVQGNKARRIVELSDLIHGLEPGRGAERVAAMGEERGEAAPVLVEVDFTGRGVGTGPEEVRDFVASLAEREGVDVRGLMTIPPPEQDARPFFARLRELRDEITESYPDVTELSMGMSADYEDAVEEGATMVRVGTAIFGARP